MNLMTDIKNKLKKSNYKSKLFIENVTLSFLIKGTAMAVSLFNMPAYMNYFANQTILGMWFTIISILSWIITFDLGIGNGLRNYLVESLVMNDVEEAKKNISSAYISVGILVIILSLISVIFIPNLNWNRILNISKEVVDLDVLIFMITMLVIGILIQLLLKLIASILFALQKSAFTGLLLLTSTILMLTFTLLAKTDNIEFNIKSISIAYVFTANIPYLIASVFLFSTKLKKCKPSFKYFRKSYVKKIVKLGGTFFYLNPNNVHVLHNRIFDFMVG
ncbi:MAG: hypothetical protein ACYC00_13940 [Eubacteriales bacterium]